MEEINLSAIHVIPHLARRDIWEHIENLFIEEIFLFAWSVNSKCTCKTCDNIFNLEESLWRHNEFVLSIEDREKRGTSRKLSISVVFKLHATNSNVNYVGTEHWMLSMWKSIFVWLFRINHSKEIMPSQDVHLSRWFDLIWFCVFLNFCFWFTRNRDLFSILNPDSQA